MFKAKPRYSLLSASSRLATLRGPHHSIMIGCLAVLLAAVMGCGDVPSPPPPVVRPVKILDLSVGADGRILELPGQLAATQNSNMAFEVPGRITGIAVDQGQRVRKGQVLARIDARDYQARLDSSKADVAAAKAEYKRVRMLFEADVTSAQNLEKAQRNYEVAEASLRTSEKALEDTVMRAPFDGVVARRLVEDYQNVRAKQTVMVVQDDSSFEIRVAVPEQNMARLPQGLTLAKARDLFNVEIEVSGHEGRRFAGVLKEFATLADPATRTYEAVFNFETPEGFALFSGMTARVLVNSSSTEEADAIFMIPARAAVPDAEGNFFVWVVDPESYTVSRRVVTLGQVTGDIVPIKSGLVSGDLIAISGVQQLAEGQKVRRLEQSGRSAS